MTMRKLPTYSDFVNESLAKVVFDPNIPRTKVDLLNANSTYSKLERVTPERITRRAGCYVESGGRGSIPEGAEPIYHVEWSFMTNVQPVGPDIPKPHYYPGTRFYVEADTSTLTYRLLALDGKLLGTWNNFTAVSKKVRELRASLAEAVNEDGGDLTSKQHRKLLDVHEKELAKNSEHGVDSFNIGSSSGGDWISSRGSKERLTSRMDPKTEKVTHSWE